MNYDFAAIEKKWQANWEKTKPYAAITGDKRPKFYGLIEFPYPSGQGLHVGHPRPVFFVPSLRKTFAQLTAEEKNAISHRGSALRAFAAELKTYLEKQ